MSRATVTGQVQTLAACSSTHIAFMSILRVPWSVEVAVTFKADSHIACRARAVPLPCRAAKGLECVFPI